MKGNGMTCGTCYGGMCGKCHGGSKLVLGLLVLANVYWPTVTWAAFIGYILVLLGLGKLVMPSCGHCNNCN